MGVVEMQLPICALWSAPLKFTFAPEMAHLTAC